MTDTRAKTPTAEHPISIAPASARVTVRVAGRTIADSTAALDLHESNYPAVHYIPMGDVDEAFLRPSDTTTYCPYKGDATYFDVVVGDQIVSDAIWTYESPYSAVDAIKGYVAFYDSRSDITIGEA